MPWNVLNKTFVIDYYRRNAGFLFLVFMVAFGIMKTNDHTALFPYIMESPLLVGLLFVVWSLYYFKTVYFIRQRLLEPQYGFLFNLNLLPVYQRWGALYLVQWANLMPVWGYSIFMSFYGLKFGFLWAVIMIWLFLLSLPIAGIWACQYRLNYPNPDTRLNRLAAFINHRFTKPYGSFFIFYLFHSEAVLLFLTKAFTCIVIFGLCKLYPTDTYDERLLSLGAALVAVCHITILARLYGFEHLQIPILRNLPIPLWKRFLQYLLIFALVLCPETLALTRYLPVGVAGGYVVFWWGFCMSVAVLIFTRFLIKQPSADGQLRTATYLFIVLFFLIMYKIPLFVLTLLAWTLAIFIFHKYYYQSDYVVDP
jgi:hypothetical protein